MKLLFVYFDFVNETSNLDYRGFRQCGLNFSIDKEYSVEKLNNTYRLFVRNKPKNQCIPKGFWGDSRLYQVTALVGDNGAGKTTLLHELIRVCSMQSEEANYHFAVLMEKTDGCISVCTNIQDIDTAMIPDLEVCCAYPEFAKRLKLILLDNTLSLSDVELAMNDRDGWNNQTVSTVSNQFYNATTAAAIQHSQYISTGTVDINTSPLALLETHFRYETFQLLRFLFDNNTRNVLLELKEAGYQVPLPRQLTVMFSPKCEPGFIQDAIQHVFPKCENNFAEWLLLNNIINAVFLEYPFSEFKSSATIHFILVAKELIAKWNEEDDTLDDEFSYFRVLHKYIWNNRPLIKRFFVSCSDDGLIYNVQIASTDEQLDPELERFMIGFIDRYRLTVHKYYYLVFSWGLSSGENSLLRMFSKLRYALDGPLTALTDLEQSSKKMALVNKINNQDVVCDSVILLLDEADLTYHPEWQRQLLALLTAFLPKLYTNPYEPNDELTGCMDLQIILTTHSPLMLGDFPNGSVIYLKKESGVTVVDNAMDRSTFGQNLYSILKDGFYLERSIGEFAHRKLNTVVDFIHNTLNNAGKNRKEYKSEELEMHRRTVSLLPAGIIKSKLTEELDACERKLFPKRNYLIKKKKELEDQLKLVNQELGGNVNK